MSSILLLLEDGEMQQFVPSNAAGQIILSQDPDKVHPDSHHDSPFADAGVEDAELGLGSHFLTADNLTRDADGNLITKIELENVPVSHDFIITVQ